ncbi:MAG TPA: glycosyltransferase, partial [Gemmatimonadaceae bacterium]|nr:glycosyltransferase [Gemmatimonadaceae bacterium]
GIRVVLTSRRWLVPSGGRAYAVANRLTNRAATAVLANSPAVARLVVAEGVRPARVVTVPNFLEDEAFALLEPSARQDARRRLGIPDGALVVGAVAQLRPVKSLETLVAAMARLVPRFPSLHLVLVGDGPSRARLVGDADALGIAEHVHFPGRLENRPNLHQLFDVSVLCSVHEGFPNTLVEAMAVGTPIVATRTGGVPDAVRHGENGLLVPPRDPARLAEAIAALLADAERRRAFGEAGRRRATAEFHVSRVLPQLEQMYEWLHHEVRP